MKLNGVNGSQVDPKDFDTAGVGGASGRSDGAERSARADFALTYNSIAPARQAILPEPKATGAEPQGAGPMAQTGFSYGMDYGTAFQPGVEGFWANSGFGYGARAGDRTGTDPNAAGSGEVIDLPPSAYSEEVSPSFTPEDVTRKSAADNATGGWSGGYPPVPEVELYGGMPIDAAVTIRDFMQAEAY